MHRKQLAVGPGDLVEQSDRLRPSRVGQVVEELTEDDQIRERRDPQVRQAAAAPGT